MVVQHWVPNYIFFIYKKKDKKFRLRGRRKSYQWKRISEWHKLMLDIQTAHAKLGSQDGNSREHETRSQMIFKWNEGSNILNAAVKWAW